MRDWQREMDTPRGFYDLQHFPLSAWPMIIRKYCPPASDHNMQITISCIPAARHGQLSPRYQAKQAEMADT